MIPGSVTCCRLLCAQRFGTQVFAFKACLLMLEDISNRLITLPSNDTCISTQYMVVVIFNMRKKIKENKNILLFVMKSGFVSEAVCCLSKGLYGFMEEERKSDSCLQRAVTHSAQSGNSKMKENSSDFVLLQNFTFSPKLFQCNALTSLLYTIKNESS